MSGINDALLFLISTLFDLYSIILIVRVLLAYAGANYFDPITQFVVRSTDFLVKPLRRFIPNVYRIEISTVLIILAIECLKYFLLSVVTQTNLSLIGIIIVALADMLKLILNTLVYAIILQVILSWVQPNSPVNFILNKITAPIMRPIQRVCPAVGGFDISPIPAIILLQLLVILIANPLMQFGLGA